MCGRQQREVELAAAHIPGVHVQRPGRELAGEVTAAERGKAVSELGRQVRLVEVADPLWILATIGPVERPLRPVQRDRTRLLLAGNGVAVGFEDGGLGPDGVNPCVCCRSAGGTGQVDGLGRRVQVRGLVRHRGDDLSAERPVRRRHRQP